MSVRDTHPPNALLAKPKCSSWLTARNGEQKHQDSLSLGIGQIILLAC
jgi:hypothetical protein